MIHNPNHHKPYPPFKWDDYLLMAFMLLTVAGTVFGVIYGLFILAKKFVGAL